MSCVSPGFCVLLWISAFVFFFRSSFVPASLGVLQMSVATLLPKEEGVGFALRKSSSSSSSSAASPGGGGGEPTKVFVDLSK